MRSKQTTIPTLCQTQGQARLSVAYRPTGRNVHASACPEIAKQKFPPIVIRGLEFHF